MWANKPEMARKWTEEHDSQIKKAAVFDELRKIAELSSRDVPTGTRVTNSYREMTKALRPGDIVITKPSKGNARPASMIVQTIQKLRREKFNNWTHSGVVSPSKAVVHSLKGLVRLPGGKTTVGGASAVREHSTDALNRLGRDVMILRPKVSKTERALAAVRARKMKGVSYNALDALRAGLYSRERESKKLKKRPISLICTAATALAYPGVEFSKKKSYRTLLAPDIIQSSSVKPVLAYSSDVKEKRAAVRTNQVPKGTKITKSLDEVRSMIQPGDVFLSKKNRTKPDNMMRLTYLLQGRTPAAEWSHAGLVTGDNEITHAYDRIVEGKDGSLNLNPGDERVRKANLKQFTGLGRDLVVLRAKGMTLEKGERAARAAKKLQGVRYSKPTLYLTGLGVSGTRQSISKDLQKVKKTGLICTAVPALAMARAKVHPGKSRLNLQPIDYLKSKKFSPVVAFSAQASKTKVTGGR